MRVRVSCSFVYLQRKVYCLSSFVLRYKEKGKSQAIELSRQEKPYFREEMYEFGDIEECFVLIEQDHIEHDTPSVHDYEENPNLFDDHILALTLEAHREDMCKSSYRRMRLWEKITKKFGWISIAGLKLRNSLKNTKMKEKSKNKFCLLKFPWLPSSNHGDPLVGGQCCDPR